jgi:UDP-N-acetylglucosamine enolpyruvyl transferase
MERAKVKARLAILLGESLADDASGIVNVAREKEIKKLANKLGRERE